MFYPPQLRRGDLLPRIVSPSLPGTGSRAAALFFEELEAPGINTLYRGAPSLVWQEARGANVLDLDGNRFIDFTAGFGVAAVGHRHPRVVRALAEQSRRLIHGLGDVMGHTSRLDLAKKLRELAPWPEDARTQTYFAVSGADAIEIAIKTALLSRPGRSGIGVFDPSYHGLSLGALAATSRPAFRDPFAAHLHHDIHRFPFGGSLEPLRQNLESGQLAAVLLEPIVGREGVLLPPEGWLAEVAALCRYHETLLVFDEIFTGFGRCGHLFAGPGEGVIPDLICCGKALGGGMPIAAVLAPADVFASWPKDGEALHTGTFVAHPLACAAALATLEVIASEKLVERARLLGEWVSSWLTALDLPKDLVEVRGRGLLFGLEFSSAAAAAAFQRRSLQRGILLLAGGPEGRVAQLVPPLTITERQLDAALGLLEQALAAT